MATRNCSIAEYELQTITHSRDHLVFDKTAEIGNLVFVYFESIYTWVPCWVIDAKDGVYEVETAYGGTRLGNLDSSKIGFAADKNGKIIHR